MKASTQANKYQLEYHAGKIIDEKIKETNKVLEWISNEVYGAGDEDLIPEYEKLASMVRNNTKTAYELTNKGIKTKIERSLQLMNATHAEVIDFAESIGY